MWIQDMRYAARIFARQPGFTAIAVITLALGIGANTAIFSIVDGVLLRPAPVSDIDQLVVVWETDRNSGTTREPASLPDYFDYRDRATRVGGLGALMGLEVNFTPDPGEPVRLPALAVTHTLLPSLGVRPLVGRGFDEEEDRPGGRRVAVIGEGFWRRSFARDPAVLGRTLRLDDNVVEIVGVMPAASDFGVFQILSAADYSRSFADRGARAEVDVWLPLQGDVKELPRATHPIFMLGRLAKGASLESAQEELSRLAGELERAHPENDGRGIYVESLGTVVFGSVRAPLLVLLGAVALVLLVACANVANLLLARGAGRRREVAVRTALGAGSRRLARQFLVESLLLTLIAAAVGIAVAQLGVSLLVGLAPADIPRIADATVDLRALVVTLVVSVVVGLAFGMVPAIQTRRVDLQTAFKGETGYGASAGRAPRRFRSVLVVAELAMAVVLVVGAGLLIKSFWRLQQIDPGFRADGVLKAEYQLPQSRYPADFSRWPNFSEMHGFTSRLLERAGALPGVESAAIAGNHPLDPGFTNSFAVAGREAEAKGWPEITIRRVSPGYFRTMGVALVTGRLVNDADGTTAAPVALINEAAATRFFGERNPLGERLLFWGAARTIVGVIGNEHFQGLDDAPAPAVYLPVLQAPSATGVLLVRTAGDPSALASAVRSAIWQIDAGLAIFGVEPLDDTLSRSVSQRRFTMALLGIFAAVALLLAAVGIYGVLGYTVSERTREIGIRMALGARPESVLGLVVRQGLTMTIAGIAIGLSGAWLLVRLLASLLYGVAPTDPATFIVVPIGLALVALAACYLPARRATKIDPVMALRME